MIKTKYCETLKYWWRTNQSSQYYFFSFFRGFLDAFVGHVGLLLAVRCESLLVVLSIASDQL